MIIRSQKPKANYTVLNNNLINDKNLDWRELGLLTFLLSKPSNWSVSQTHLAKSKKSGVDSVRASLKRLQEAGYVTYKRKHSGEVDWYVFDEPQVENPSGEKPKREKPRVEKPHVENPTLISKELITSKEKDNKSPLPPNAVKELFNETATNLPPVLKLNEKRIKAIKKLSEFDIPTLEAWRAYFCKANESNFLNGKSSDWKATFDWLLKPDNALKVAEGNYDNKVSSSDNWMDGLEDEAHG